MATYNNATLKRYNASTGVWDTINISTTIAQVEGLNTALENAKSAQLIRNRANNISLSNVGNGDTVGSVITDVSLNKGDTILIEFNKYSGDGLSPKYMTITLASNSTSPNTTNSDSLLSFQTWNGTNLNTYSFSVSYSSNTLYFGSKKYISGSFSGTEISWTTGTYILYVGRVWRLRS